MRDIVTVAAIGVVTMAGPPALAYEGPMTQSVASASAGWLSKIWYDNNVDAYSTSIYFSGCDRATQKMGVYKQVTGIDPNMGYGWLCSEKTGYWGDMPADDYRFKFEEGTFIDISYMRVRW